MKQPWNDPLPDGIRPTPPSVVMVSRDNVHELRQEAVSPIMPVAAPLGLVPLHVALMALAEFCDQHKTNWSLGKRGLDGAAHMVCQISTPDGRLMASAAMFELPRAILQAVDGARVWVGQREAKAA